MKYTFILNTKKECEKKKGPNVLNSSLVWVFLLFSRQKLLFYLYIFF
jgi:hypothetical protein